MNILNNLKTPVTPDFGLSDIWHQYLPFKFFLAQGLKKGKIPLWSSQIGNGQPILGQGQMGAFNLANLILFGLFPFSLAVTLFYIINFLIAFLGAYLLALSLKFKKPIALFFSLSFCFSGFMICHLSHWDIFQATSLLPFAFFFLNQALEKKNYKYFLGLSFIISQQIFTGASQIVFINLLGLFIFLFMKIVNQKSSRSRIIFLFFLSVLLSLGLSAIQILPSWQYMKYSIRSQGLSFSEATAFPYPLKHFLTFWQPFFFGNPKHGTYPVFNEKWGIFWENTAYFGKTALILSLIAIAAKLKKKRKFLKKTALIILIFSVLLVLGKNSPFYFIFTFFPFNLFRVPSRFLILTLFSLLILLALGLEQVIRAIPLSLRASAKQSNNNKWRRYRLLRRFTSRNDKLYKKNFLIIIYLIIIINTFDIAYHFLNYHSWQNFNRWLSPPQTAKFLLKNSAKEKIVSLGSSSEWNKIFLEKGWNREEESFYYLRNSLDPNFNLLFNLNQLKEHNSIPLKRNYYLDSLLSSQITFDNDEKALILTDSALKILSLNNVKYIISPFSIKSEKLKEVYQTMSPKENLPYFKIYQLNSFLAFARISFDYKTAQTLQNFSRIIDSIDFDAQKTVILENEIGETLKQGDYQIKIEKKGDEEIALEVTTNQRGILTLADNFYPEWKAAIDNKKAKIFPVNLVQKGIVIPPGKHKVYLYYQGKFFKIGACISLATALIFIIGICRKKLFF